jgi:hypothetical protein
MNPPSHVESKTDHSCLMITEAPVSVDFDHLGSLISGMGHAPVGEAELVEIAVQLWRLDQRVQRVATGGSDPELRRLSDSVKRLRGALERLEVDFEDPLHREYNDGWLEVEVVAWEQPDAPPPSGVQGPWVKQTLRPIVRRSGQLISRGEVVVTQISDLNR